MHSIVMGASVLQTLGPRAQPSISGQMTVPKRGSNHWQPPRGSDCSVEW